MTTLLLTIAGGYIALGIPAAIVLAIIDPPRNPYATTVFEPWLAPLTWPVRAVRYLRRRRRHGRHHRPGSRQP